MKDLLYIGNRLTNEGLNATTIDTLSKQLEGEGFAIATSSSKRNQLFRLLDMLITVVKNSNVDYVLIDTYSTSAFWYAFFVSQLCRFLKIKYIPILHGGNLPFRLDNSPKLSRMIFNNSHINVAPSNYLLDEFKKRGFVNTIHIPNSIEVEKYSFKLRDKIAPKLFWVRAFASIYNPQLAIDVLKELKVKFPEATLCMVGPDKDGSLDKVKKYSKSLNLDVEYTGKLSKKEWHEKSSSFDVFINTTNFDNTPVSVIEAMSLGLPIVSTNVGGLPFLIENNKTGLLVRPNDIKEMVSAVEKLLNDNEFVRNLSLNGRLASEIYNWQIVKEKWIEILNN